jgi:hypothetical protein
MSFLTGDSTSQCGMNPFSLGAFFTTDVGQQLMQK